MLSAQAEVERLLDQIRAVTNNPVVERASDQIEVLCRAYMEPTSEGHEYGLTKSLAAMFALLSKRRGHPVSHSALMNVSERQDGEPEDALRVMRVQICRLRRRLKPHGYEIEPVLGHGYRMTKWPAPTPQTESNRAA